MSKFDGIKEQHLNSLMEVINSFSEEECNNVMKAKKSISKEITCPYCRGKAIVYLNYHPWCGSPGLGHSGNCLNNCFNLMS